MAQKREYAEKTTSDYNFIYYHEYGIRMVGELVPYLMKTGEYNSPGMIQILKEAGK